MNTVTTKTKFSFDDIESQIYENQAKVAFDVKEFTIEWYVNKLKSGELFIPKYQRDFVWDKKRQAKFIESIILDLPIPFIFVADVYDSLEKDEKNGYWEIIDGSQRIRTLDAFINNELKLTDLKVLDKLNGLSFNDFSINRKRRFLNSTVKMIQISEKSDPQIRFTLFERINTGGINLTRMQQRKGIYYGKFLEFISECTKHPVFVELSDVERNHLELEELVLKFFAYLELETELNKNYRNLQNILDSYVNKNRTEFNESLLSAIFNQSLEFINEHFKRDFFEKQYQRSRICFECILIGVGLALKTNSNLKPTEVINWFKSSEFNNLFIKEIKTTPARIDFVKNKLLGQ